MPWAAAASCSAYSDATAGAGVIGAEAGLVEDEGSTGVVVVVVVEEEGSDGVEDWRGFSQVVCCVLLLKK